MTQESMAVFLSKIFLAMKNETMTIPHKKKKIINRNIKMVKNDSGKLNVFQRVAFISEYKGP